MAAVHALPGELLRALQNAELCDPGILLAYPRGNAELMVPLLRKEAELAEQDRPDVYCCYCRGLGYGYGY